jgi:CRISPR-associated endonuclease Cas1
MAASGTLPQQGFSRKFPIGKSGVLTLSGFGIKVRMQSGHLEIEDGIGPERRKFRLARIGHGLKRLVLIGSDGFITLEAMRWLADQDAAFVMLDRGGSVLATTGPVRPSDVRLRRAQAMAGQSGIGVQIARDLIDKKLAGQERVARHKLLTIGSANAIAQCRAALSAADTLDRIRQIESRAAVAYWSVWRDLPISFPKADQCRVPIHWRSFGMRASPLTGSPRLAVNPPNAMLNYLYAILESEASLAAATLGLDPGMGVLHVDTKARDSLACDLMEAIRPQVDAYLIDWVTRCLLKRDWFVEQRDGNCRLMAQLAMQLSETAPVWRRAVAPIAESVARMFWTPAARRFESHRLPTRLTQRHKRKARGAAPLPTPIFPPRRENVCGGCGKTIGHKFTNCKDCAGPGWSKHMVDIARTGRLTANSPQALAKKRNTQRRNHEARRAWNPSSQPLWLTEGFYSEKIQPLLAELSNATLARTIGVSRVYAARIRRGAPPHPRHWQSLSRLVGIDSSD